MEYPEFEPDVDGGPCWGRGLCECLEGVREVACPYSEVDDTDRAVSAGKYGTGTVLIPPFREYLDPYCEPCQDLA